MVRVEEGICKGEYVRGLFFGVMEMWGIEKVGWGGEFES
jgi:hypothetical protein